MTWTYNTAALATSPKDQVRLEIGDTVQTAPLLQDEEIQQAITVELNIWGAAARCCEIISRQLLRKADVRIGRGGTSLTYSAAAKQYTDMAAALRAKASAMHAPWAGGTSNTAKDSAAADSDLVQPIFTKTMQGNPWVGGQGSDTPSNDGQGEAE